MMESKFELEKGERSIDACSYGTSGSHAMAILSPLVDHIVNNGCRRSFARIYI